MVAPIWSSPLPRSLFAPPLVCGYPPFLSIPRTRRNRSLTADLRYRSHAISISLFVATYFLPAQSAERLCLALLLHSLHSTAHVLTDDDDDLTLESLRKLGNQLHCEPYCVDCMVHIEKQKPTAILQFIGLYKIRNSTPQHISTSAHSTRTAPGPPSRQEVELFRRQKKETQTNILLFKTKTI